MTYKYFKKLELACTIGSVALVVGGSIATGLSLNPIVLTISAAGVLLKSEPELQNYKRKIKMCIFAYILMKRFW